MVADASHSATMRLRDGDLVLRPKRRSDAEAITAACQAGFRDTGRLTGSLRAEVDEPVYAVYEWTAS